MPRLPFKPKLDLFGNPIRMPQADPTTPKGGLGLPKRVVTRPDGSVATWPDGAPQIRPELPPNPLDDILSRDRGTPIDDFLTRFESKERAAADPKKPIDLGPDPISEIQRMLGEDFQADQLKLQQPVPKRNFPNTTTMPNDYRRHNDGLPTREFQSAERNRDLPISRNASDVVDPLSPNEFVGDTDPFDIDLGNNRVQGVHGTPGDAAAFARPYQPGEIERALTVGLPPEVAEEATSKIGSLANRMGQDEFLRLTQDLGSDPDIIRTLDDALSLTSPEQIGRPALGDPKALPIEALDRPPVEYPSAPGGRQGDPRLRIKRQYVGKPRTEAPGMLRDDIGEPVRQTPWGGYKPSYGNTPMGREGDSSVGDIVDVDGLPIRGKVQAITGGTKQVDVRQMDALLEGDESRTGGFSDQIDLTNPDLTTTRLGVSAGFPKKIQSLNPAFKVTRKVGMDDSIFVKRVLDDQGKPIEGGRWEKISSDEALRLKIIDQPLEVPPNALVEKKSLKPQIARVEMFDGTIQQKPLSRIKRVTGAQVDKVDDLAQRDEILALRQQLEGTAPTERIKGSVPDQLSHPLSREIIPPTKEGVDPKSARSANIPEALNPAAPGVAKVGGSQSKNWELAKDAPTAGGFYWVRKVHNGKPIGTTKISGGKRIEIPAGKWQKMSIDEAIQNGIVKPNGNVIPRKSAVPPVGENVSEAEIQKIAASAPEVKPTQDSSVLKTGALGGRWTEPPVVGSFHKINVDGQDLLVRVTKVEPAKTDRKVRVEWKRVGKLENGVWKALGVGAMAAGASLLDPEESEAGPRLPNPALKNIRTAQSAPIVDRPSLPLSTRLKTEVTNATDIVEHGATKLREAFPDQINPESSPENFYGLHTRGGLAPSEKTIEELTQFTDDVLHDKSIADAFQDSTNLGGYQRVYNIVKEKRDRAQLEADTLYAEGKEEDGLRKAQEAGAYTTRIRENKLVPGGLSEEAIKTELARIEESLTPEQKGRIEKAQKGMFEITRRLLDKARQEGLISDEQFKFYAGRGNDYLPMYRLGELFDPESGVLIRTRGLDNSDFRTSQAKTSLLDETVIDQKLEGSERINVHPVVGVVQYIDGLESEIQRNKAAKNALTFYESQQSNIRKMMADGDDSMGMYLMTRLGTDPPPASSDPTRARVGFMEKGMPVYFDVDADFASAMTHVSPEVMRGAMALTRNVRLLTHMGVASAYPPFMLTQVLKDPVAAMIKPDYAKYQKSGNPLQNTLETGMAMAEFVKNAVIPSKKYTNEPERAMSMSGAVNTYIDPHEKVMGFEKGVWNRESKLARKLLRTSVWAGGQVIDKSLGKLERRIKGATYDTMRDRGFKPVEAGADTRKFGGSPDFNMQGRLARKAKDHIMFLTPFITGLSSSLESMKTDPAKYVKVATLTGLGLAALQEHNDQFVDEKGNREIKKVPLEDQRNNLIVFYGDPEITASGDRRTPYWKIPIPHELSLLMSPVLAVMHGRDNPEYTAVQGVADIASNFIPGGGKLDASNPGDFINSLGRRIGGSLNPVVKYPLETFMDKELMSNTPIVGTRVEGQLPEYQATMRTPPAAVAIGKQLGVSPDRVAHFMKSAFPGIASLVPETITAALGEKGERPTAGVESETEQMLRAPFMGQFARRFQGQISTNAEKSRLLDTFHTFRARTQNAANTISGQSKRNPWEVGGIPKDAIMLAQVNPQMTKFQGMLSQIDQARELVTRSPEMGIEEKKAALRRMYQAEEEILKQTKMMIGELEKQGIH